MVTVVNLPYYTLTQLEKITQAIQVQVIQVTVGPLTP